jgi:hypothetical protein
MIDAASPIVALEPSIRDKAKQIVNMIFAAARGLTHDASPLPSRSFVNLRELEQLCQEQPASYVVEGLLPADDVHVAVGDSGLGKTPWAYQLGLCVATGQPFLGFPVQQGRVLYFDGENGLEQIKGISDSLCNYLRIEECPENFLVRTDETGIANAAKRLKPSLVIVDTLRALYPDAERSNDEMARLLNDLRLVARKERSAILLLHHPRKPNAEKPVPPLENLPPLEWLNEASGARAFINQTTTRIAFDRTKRNPDAAFVMKFHVKTKGPSESIYIERVLDEDGGDLGYRRLIGVALLGNDEQQAAFQKLPAQFTFKQAKHTYGRSDDPTRDWLLKCVGAGLVRQTGRGLYQKAA